ncbi:MAG: ydfG [Gammaproteobacteria bacterium]|jgi:NADP-dependent 3-hydroxy acid dehydrogenase YdfG|nr:ydfG [Gammaproteobacteria bacterium]
MMKLKNKVICITGASSGIGKACAEQLAALGANLIITARRFERLQALAQTLSDQHAIQVLPIQLDVADKTQVKKVFAELPEQWKNIDVLVNNAGLALTTDKVQDANIDHWDTMLNTNVHGLLYVTHAILPSMITRDCGHIINLGSVAGFQTYPGGNIYCATKHAVRAISRSLKIDLLGTKVRVTEIAPGAVETEFSEVRFSDKQRAKNFYQDFTPLNADDIADAVVYAATRPAHVNIAEIVLYPTDQSNASLIHRK